MLLSLVEALGHDYNDLLEGASQNTACGDEDLLLKVGFHKSKKKGPALKRWMGKRKG
jgi:hypothetical protein